MSAEETEYTWPANFPEGIPDRNETIPAEGHVYRLARTYPPTQMDFVPHREEKPNYPYRKDQIPLSYGVSVWTKLDKIKQVARNYPCPEQYGNWHTVCGDLCSGLGVIPKETTMSGHVTLWVQEGAKPHEHIIHEVDE
ncbi:hypothetical protein JCM19233_6063 [Vibrio astriarenae]|nr:hypothetical protein JCM19233_6063 [Vibrio sp. C7]